MGLVAAMNFADCFLIAVSLFVSELVEMTHFFHSGAVGAFFVGFISYVLTSSYTCRILFKRFSEFHSIHLPSSLMGILPFSSMISPLSSEKSLHFLTACLAVFDGLVSCEILFLDLSRGTGGRCLNRGWRLSIASFHLTAHGISHNQQPPEFPAT